MNIDIPYYTTFTDVNGHEHYAVHKWNRLTGFVTSMRDIMFWHTIKFVDKVLDGFLLASRTSSL